MRARFGLADALLSSGRADDGIEHYFELLRLNPNDNQGVRYRTLPALLATGRDVEAGRLLKQFDEESAVWAYARALLAVRLSGPSEAAARELRAALRINEHVPTLLEPDSPIPQPPHYALGSFEEACIAAEEVRPAFQATPGALDWIAAESARRTRQLDKLRREKRRKERAKLKKRKRR
jgi:tetratricopeptide (TPR) repeat protein